MNDNIEKKGNLSVLAQSDGWRLICEAIDDNISRLDKMINDDSVDCALSDEKMYTPRVLNIKQKKILLALKDFPRKLIENMTDSFDEEDVLKDILG